MIDTCMMIMNVLLLDKKAETAPIKKDGADANPAKEEKDPDGPDEVTPPSKEDDKEDKPKDQKEGAKGPEEKPKPEEEKPTGGGDNKTDAENEGELIDD